MRTKNDINRENAKELSRLIAENKQLRVIAWINSDGITDEHPSFAGNIESPCIKDIFYSHDTSSYVERKGVDLEDCYNYYGEIVNSWTDEEIAAYAKEIPWEHVITFNVSAV